MKCEKCIVFEKDGKRYFESDNEMFLQIITEEFAKEHPNRVWIFQPNGQLEYLLGSYQKRNPSIEKVQFTDNKEEVDIRTAKAVDIKDIPFLRAYYLQKYQDEMKKYYKLIRSLE